MYIVIRPKRTPMSVVPATYPAYSSSIVKSRPKTLRKLLLRLSLSSMRPYRTEV